MVGNVDFSLVFPFAVETVVSVADRSKPKKGMGFLFSYVITGESKITTIVEFFMLFCGF